MVIKQNISTLLHSLLKDAAVPVFSGPLRGWKWLPPSGNHAYWLGKHEKAYVNAFAEHIQPGDIVFDIGAQAGYFTLIASRLAGKNGQVVAFEPFPENSEYIKEHCRLNHCDNVTLQEVAVGGTPGQRSFQSANLFMGHLSDIASDKSAPDENALVVEVVTLDSLIADNKAPIPSVLKIDTEGMEYWVLQGGKSFINEHKPVLFIATHGAVNQKRTLELLKAWGYDITMIGEGNAKNADYVAKPMVASS